VIDGGDHPIADYDSPVRLAWFSPLPPVRSGVAAYSAELLPMLRADYEIDTYVHARSDRDRFDLSRQSEAAADAHEFVWRQRRRPYDLVVYQLGNAPCHDYMWAYLASFPGLVVLHDARLHHARARQLLRLDRVRDYRAEFQFDHPDAVHDFADYATEGLGGAVYYFWSMLRVVMRTARTVAVHNARVGADLRREYPATPIESIRMGVPAPAQSEEEVRTRVRAALGVPPRAIVFVAFGKVTAEKRVDAILRAFRVLLDEGVNAYLVFVGDDDEYPALRRERAASDRVRVTGYVEDSKIGEHLASADACLCLRWPTALETSASWLRALAAGRATMITSLAHLADIPVIDPLKWRATHAREEPVALSIDLLDEDRGLVSAMRRLATDAEFRNAIAGAGHRHWSRLHRLEMMTADYRQVIAATAERAAPDPGDLPLHVAEDYSAIVRQVTRQFDLDLYLDLELADREPDSA